MSTIQTRVDSELKEQAESLFKDMGITMTDAIRLFLKQSVNQGGLPFQPMGKRPNIKTLEALNDPEGKTYKTVEELSSLWK